MAAPAAAVPAAPRRRSLVPAEGWSTLLLHLVVVLAAASTVELTPLAPARSDLALLSVGGVLAGLVLAKLRAPDLLAHLLAVVTGVAVAAWLAVAGVSGPGSELVRLRALGAQALEWYRRALSGRPIDDPLLLSIVLGLTVWLVAYTSAWALYRRGWLATALVLPGVVAFVNLGFAGDVDALPLVVLIAAGCVLAARYHAFRRGRAWASAALPAPPRIDRRFLIAGFNLALVAAILGWTLPISARDGLGAAWERLEQPWSQVQERWDDLLGRFAGVSDVGGSYATFGNKFRLGGALNLSDEPVMVYRPEGAAAGPTYLVGHRYDAYDGHGWAAATADDDSGRFNAQMTFSRNQGIHLSPSATGQRSEVRGLVEPIRPKGDMLFTRDTYLTADLRTNVQLAWQRLEAEPFDLTGGNPAALPVDLRRFGALLMGAAFDPAAAGEGAGRPAPTDAAVAAQVAAEADALSSRFLDVSWTVGANGRAETLVVTGELPVYDDVEAVFSAAPLEAGGQYEVVGLVSMAAPDALRSAGTDYPAWLVERYLQLPDTVTQRTRDLAAQLAAGQPTPFDTALAVQDYVRATIAYKEDIAPPPAGQDVVDFVLFDSREGYCEYYASAMTVMLRMNGIPSRVVAGYFPAPWDEASEGYLYREKNAHLWVEAWFPGYGWIPFEPTASQQPLEYGALDMTPEPTPIPTPAPTPVPTAEAVATPAPVAEAPPDFPPAMPDVLAQPVRYIGWAALGLLLLGVVAAVVVALAWQWRLRGLSPAGALYARAVRAGSVMGVKAEPYQTPREYADRLGGERPALRAPARLVADLYSQEIYAGRPPGPSALRSARAAWSELRRAMLDALVRRRSARAEPRR